MVVEKKEEIKELWEIVNDYIGYLPDAYAGSFRKDQNLPVPTLTDPRAVVDFYEAMVVAILSRYTYAVSESEVIERFEIIARGRLIDEMDLEGIIPSHDDLLSKLKPDYKPTEIEELSIGDIYLLGSALEKCLNPDIYCAEQDKQIFDGIKVLTTLAAYAVAHFIPPIHPAQAKSILATMMDNVKRYTEVNRANFSQAEWAETLARIDKSYQQIDIIFEGR